MAKPLWDLIHDERRALAQDLEGLTDAQWATPSLCEGWTVREVLAHMTATNETSMGGFFVKLARHGFSFQKMTRRDIDERTTGSPADALARFKASIPKTTAPPGPPVTWLGEAIVHGEDVRRPLGIKRDYPIARLERVLDSYKRSNLLIGTKSRIKGLTLKATDAGYVTGSGPEVRGTLLDLVLAGTGRKAALENLEGEGVATLTSRMASS